MGRDWSKGPFMQRAAAGSLELVSVCSEVVAGGRGDGHILRHKAVSILKLVSPE